LDKTESETPVNLVDMSQAGSEKEKYIENSTVQNDIKAPASDVELNNMDVQLNKEIDNDVVQYAAEFPVVSNF